MTDTASDQGGKKIPGTIRQKQRGYVALRLHAVGGEFDSDQIRAIAGVAEKYGRGRLHLSTRQGIEIHNVRASGSGRRSASWSPRADHHGLPRGRHLPLGDLRYEGGARELDSRYFAAEAPYKFKIAVTGCPNNCAKATENDIGVMGAIVPAWEEGACDDCGACTMICPKSATRKVNERYVVDAALCLNCSRCTTSCPRGAWTVVRRGFVLWIGGTMGKTPRLATRIDGGDRLTSGALCPHRPGIRVLPAERPSEGEVRAYARADRVRDRDPGDRGRSAKPLISVVTHPDISSRIG